MKTLKKLYLILIAIGICNVCNAQSLERAFNTISDLPNFENKEMSATEGGFPAEMGTLKVTGHRNSEPRDIVLDIIQKIPENLLKINQVNERGKIFRVYTEKLNRNQALFMQVFIGRGANDLTVCLFEGAPIEYYETIVSEIKEGM